MKTVKRVLITGASGFIGSRLSEIFGQYSDFEVYRGVRKVDSGEAGRQIPVDLADLQSLLGLCEDHNFDVIVHLAAKVGWGGLPYEDLYIENVLATGALGYVAKKMDASLLFCSAAVVHGQKESFVSLDTPICLDSDYSRSKFDGEELLRSILPSACILRVGGVFGKNGPAHLGLNRSISEALQGNIPVVYGEGGCLRNYIYVDDLCLKIIGAIKSGAEGIHLIAGDETLSIKNMLQIICKEILGCATPLFKAGLRPGVDQLIDGTPKFGKGHRFIEAVKLISGSSI